jgi:hypothetical protein
MQQGLTFETSSKSPAGVATLRVAYALSGNPVRKLRQAVAAKRGSDPVTSGRVSKSLAFQLPLPVYGSPRDANSLPTGLPSFETVYRAF